jgi:hypothetical protein
LCSLVLQVRTPNTIQLLRDHFNSWACIALKTWKRNQNKIFSLGFDDWLIIGQMSDENPPRIEGSEVTELPSCA